MAIQRDFPSKNPSSLVILDFKWTQTAKILKTRFLRKTENGRAGSHICFTLPKWARPQAKKVLKKLGEHGFFGSAVKTAEITARPVWG